jgi:hypothetical protein
LSGKVSQVEDFVVMNHDVLLAIALAVLLDSSRRTARVPDKHLLGFSKIPKSLD